MARPSASMRLGGRPRAVGGRGARDNAMPAPPSPEPHECLARLSHASQAQFWNAGTLVDSAIQANMSTCVGEPRSPSPRPPRHSLNLGRWAPER